MIDLQQLRSVIDAPPKHPEITGDGVIVSRRYLDAMHRELSESRSARAGIVHNVRPAITVLVDGAGKISGVSVPTRQGAVG